eukprot:jgi/Chlat1/5996/Chrsp4S06192
MTTDLVTEASEPRLNHLEARARSACRPYTSCSLEFYDDIAILDTAVICQASGGIRHGPLHAVELPCERTEDAQSPATRPASPMSDAGSPVRKPPIAPVKRMMALRGNSRLNHVFRSDTELVQACSTETTPQATPQATPLTSPKSEGSFPVLRAGVAEDIGRRRSMEDAHSNVQDFTNYVFATNAEPLHAYFGVFDGHGGACAAQYARDHLLMNILAESHFPSSAALRAAFLATDAGLHSRFVAGHEREDSGTTAIVALILGRTLVLANLGDCRGVLSSKGKAVELTVDQKPETAAEYKRICAAGGRVEFGQVNGLLGVARALGDWHVKGKDGSEGPLSAVPEVSYRQLLDEDEFLILGCDGLWDVFSNENAVEFATRQLQIHNDPVRCSQALVEEAIRRDSTDNVSVITICFQADAPARRSESPRMSSVIRRTLSTEALSSLQSCLRERDLSS